jgi:hypothetical protein
MSLYIDTFKRYEIKYLLDERQYRELRDATSSLLLPDQYGRSTIGNIYFDTPDYRMIRASIERPVYKEKLRIRSYKTPSTGDTVFVELKKKYKGIVYKRRIDLSLGEAEAYLYEGGKLSAPSQISREIDYVMGFYPDIGPMVALYYDRIAFYGTEDPNLRVTIDSKLTSRRTGLSLADGPGGDMLLDSSLRLMELKTTGSIPLWLTHLLDNLQIYPTSFSKYGRAYQLTEQGQTPNTLNERKIICA